MHLVDLLHDLPHASQACKEFYRICKPDGTLSVTEFYAHTNPKENVGADLVQILASFSLYYYLGISMSVEGSEAIGTCAGIEKFTALIEQGGFDFKGRGKMVKHSPIDVFFSCGK